MKAPAIEKLVAHNGQETLKANLEDGRSVYLHSSYDPDREAECWANEIHFEPEKNIILFGLGLGYHLKPLLSKIGPDVKILIIEPCNQIRELAEQTAETSSLLRLPRISISSDWNSFRQAFEQSQSSWQETLLLRLPSYQEAFSKEYQSFLSKLRSQISSVLGNLCTLVTSSQAWQENCLRNLRYLNESAPVSDTFGEFAGKPFIIVSAGPSLAKNIDLLCLAKGRAFILAVGTVNRLLASKGIVPDLVASFDGMEGNYRHHFQGLSSEDICLLFDPAVHYKVVSEHAGPKSLMLINPANSWLEEYSGKKIGQVRIGPSIANTAFDLACKLGADPIIFVGQDLAFTNDATHAEGTHLKGLRGFDYDISNPVHKFGRPTDPAKGKSLRKLLSVEGLNGEKVQTDTKMLTYLHWFEERIQDLSGTRKVINATEGGALIRGARSMTLKQTLEQFCQEDISSSIEHIRRILTRKPHYDLKKLVTYLKTVRKSARRLAPQCKKGARLSKVLKEHHKGTKSCHVRRVLEKLNRIDQMLVREEQNYRPLHYLTSPILGLLSSQAKKSDEPLEVSHYSYVLYRELNRAFSRSLPLLDQLIEALESTSIQDPPLAKGAESMTDIQATPIVRGV